MLLLLMTLAKEYDKVALAAKNLGLNLDDLFPDAPKTDQNDDNGEWRIMVQGITKR